MKQSSIRSRLFLALSLFISSDIANAVEVTGRIKGTAVLASQVERTPYPLRIQ